MPVTAVNGRGPQKSMVLPCKSSSHGLVSARGNSSDSRKKSGSLLILICIRHQDGEAGCWSCAGRCPVRPLLGAARKLWAMFAWRWKMTDCSLYAQRTKCIISGQGRVTLCTSTIVRPGPTPNQHSLAAQLPAAYQGTGWRAVCAGALVGHGCAGYSCTHTSARGHVPLQLNRVPTVALPQVLMTVRSQSEHCCCYRTKHGQCQTERLPVDTRCIITSRLFIRAVFEHQPSHSLSPWTRLAHRVSVTLELATLVELRGLALS